MLCPVDYPSMVSWPDRGLSSLTVLPTLIRERSSSLYRIIEDYSKLRAPMPPLRVSGRENSEPILPIDPRQWSREDVAHWVEFVGTTNHLPTIQANRFAMNGKALCLMSMEMFVNRVPLGGKLLFKDFQLRLNRALYS